MSLSRYFVSVPGIVSCEDPLYETFCCNGIGNAIDDVYSEVIDQ